MTNFKATIYEKDGTTEVLKDMVVRIEEVGGNITSWHGSLEIGDKPIPLDGQHRRIKLDDGRSGDILINNMSAGSHGETQMTFQGSGPLS